MLEFLPDRVIEILSERAAGGRKILFEMNCSEMTFEKVVKEAITAAGLVYGRHVPGGITFHSNRHSFTTRMIQVADLATARSYTGHSNAAMVAYYSHASADSRREAMQKMYGDDRSSRLATIYDAVRDGKMDFEDFEKLIKTYGRDL